MANTAEDLTLALYGDLTLDSDDSCVQPVQTKLKVGQIVTVSWDAGDKTLGTNRYVWRCVGCQFDGQSSAYAGLTMSNAGRTGTATYTVITAGNILLGGYAAELTNTAFQGNFIKVKIADPE